MPSQIWAEECTVKFSREKWNALTSMSDYQREEALFRCERGKMVCDLRRNVLKSGITKKELIDTLGRPDQDEGVPNCLVYWIGYCGTTANTVAAFCVNQSGAYDPSIPANQR